MKCRLPILLLLAAVSAFGEPAVTNVTIHLAVQTNSVSWNAANKSVVFMCRATIQNLTRDTLTVSNLFQDRSGLSLKVTDKHGMELTRLYAAPFHRSTFTIVAGDTQSFWPYYGIMNRFLVPETNTTVKLQLDGKLIGNGCKGVVASDIAILKIP